MKVKKLYKYFIEEHIGPYLKSRRFKQDKSAFKIIKNGNLGIIDFQKSRNSTESTIIFTVNLAVVLRTIYEFEGHHVSIDKLGEEQGHWRERLGYLMPEKTDVWWEIKESIDVKQLASLLIKLIEEYGIKALMKYIKDGNLLELWLTDEAPGLTEMQRLEYLSVLLKSMGRNEMLSRVVRGLRELSSGKPVANSVEAHIRLLDEKIRT